MQITDYRAEHEHSVFELFEKVFGRRMTPEFWQWRFYNNFGKPIRYLMWDGDRLVGHYVVHPLPFKLFENVENILFSMSSMTHPDYRGRGIYQELATKVYDEATRQKYKIVVGFSNMNSYKIHSERLGWINFGRMVEFEKQIQDSSLEVQGSTPYEIKEFPKFDSITDDIWERNKNKHSLLFPRDQTFLNWRYTEHPIFSFMHYPNFVYHKYLVTFKNEPVAYFVLKSFGSEKGHVVDLFGDLNQKVLRIVIGFAIRYCINSKLPRLSFWTGYQEDLSLQKLLTTLGFTRRESETYFGIKLLNPNLSMRILDKTQWFIRMGDSDVY